MESDFKMFSVQTKLIFLYSNVRHYKIIDIIQQLSYEHILILINQ